MSSTRKIGIIGAMPEEIEGVIQLLSSCSKTTFGQRDYYSGHLHGIEAVVVFSRWGKVAAATTVTALILEFGITELLFTGVAGAIHADLNIGDMVIGKKLIQHDMDARPLMEQFEIPLLGKHYFESNPYQIKLAEKAIYDLFEHSHLQQVISNKDLAAFNITQPKLLIGEIASGDQFFSSKQQKQALRQKLPDVLCVEMEGAAVAQVCFEYGIPFCIIRTISDTADEKAHIDFPAFIQKISSIYSTEIVKHLYAS